jgi:thioredoxin-dependent peroxiredoxin
MPLSANTPAPDFTLMDESGKTRKLSEYSNQWVLLYFYPKDDTPGCTTEACSFRDDYSAYQKAGITILGVSPDSPKSHAKFKEKYALPFTLLADEEHKVCELYQVWGIKKMMGREYYGVYRTTFLINPKGIITQVFEGVKPAEHSAEVLAAFKK